MTAAATDRGFSAAIFDMDGLLLDSERPIRDAWLELAAIGEADYLRTVGRNRDDSLALLAERFGSLAAAEAMYERVDAHLAALFRGRAFDLKPGALRLLDALRDRGIPCALASSTRHAKVIERLSAAGIVDRFAAIHGGDQVARGKPAPDLFLLAARSLGIAPAHAVVFEDSSLGAAGALEAGMGCVLVPDLKQPDPAIAPHCLVLENLADALPYLPTWFD